MPDIKEKLLKGYKAGKKTFKVHIDGFNMLPYLKGEVKESPRQSFFYISDDGDILAIRMQDWKVVLMEQRAKQLMCWIGAVREAARARSCSTCAATRSSAPTRTRTPIGTGIISHAYIIYMMQGVVAKQIENFVKFPPRQKPASFNLDAVMRDLEEAGSGRNH